MYKVTRPLRQVALVEGILMQTVFDSFRYLNVEIYSKCSSYKLIEKIILELTKSKNIHSVILVTILSG